MLFFCLNWIFIFFPFAIYWVGSTKTLMIRPEEAMNANQIDMETNKTEKTRMHRIHIHFHTYYMKMIRVQGKFHNRHSDWMAWQMRKSFKLTLFCLENGNLFDCVNRQIVKFHWLHTTHTSRQNARTEIRELARRVNVHLPNDLDECTRKVEPISFLRHSNRCPFFFSLSFNKIK